MHFAVLVLDVGGSILSRHKILGSCLSIDGNNTSPARSRLFFRLTGEQEQQRLTDHNFLKVPIGLFHKVLL